MVKGCLGLQTAVSLCIQHHCPPQVNRYIGKVEVGWSLLRTQALEPERGEKSAWYTLYGHALNCRDIPWLQLVWRATPSYHCSCAKEVDLAKVTFDYLSNSDQYNLIGQQKQLLIPVGLRRRARAFTLHVLLVRKRGLARSCDTQLLTVGSQTILSACAGMAANKAMENAINAASIELNVE